MERTVYSCDRCYMEAFIDKDWTRIYHLKIYQRDKTLLCSNCFEAFKKFLKELTAHEG